MASATTRSRMPVPSTSRRAPMCCCTQCSRGLAFEWVSDGPMGYVNWLRAGTAGIDCGDLRDRKSATHTRHSLAGRTSLRNREDFMPTSINDTDVRSVLNQARGPAPQHRLTPSPVDWWDCWIYFLLADRFRRCCPPSSRLSTAKSG